jgi:hypothetical protein
MRWSMCLQLCAACFQWQTPLKVEAEEFKDGLAGKGWETEREERERETNRLKKNPVIAAPQTRTRAIYKQMMLPSSNRSGTIFLKK